MNQIALLDSTENPVEDSAAVEPLVRLWLLRLLVPLGVGRDHFDYTDLVATPNGDLFDRLAEIFDTGNEWYHKPHSRKNPRPRKAFAGLRKLHKEAEKTSRNVKATGVLAVNLARLARLTGLSATDCRILEFAVLVSCDDLLGKTCALLDELSMPRICKTLSVLLGLPQAEIRSALSKKGNLFRTGLITFSTHYRHHYRNDFALDLQDCLEFISPSFAENMVEADADPMSWLDDVVFPCAPAQLSMDDFSHKAKELAILLPYLKKSLVTQRRGVNFLIYGNPGTGKSQLARVLAEASGCQLFEVGSEDGDGEPLIGTKRLRSFRAAQSFLVGSRVMLLFDEIGDIFDAGNDWILSRFLDSSETTRAPNAWLNKKLEENRVPTLWLANSITGIHPAYKRRFDMIIKMPVPPKCQRRKILRASCADLLGAQDIERIAHAETLAPAVVTRASAVVTAVGEELPQPQQAPALELIINNTLEAQGHERIHRYDPNRLPDTYDPAFVHVDADLESLAEGLKKTRAGRLCLYGPPGTGKTAYARWLAQQLEAPLFVRRGADLIDCWVGATEKNIAASFRQAETEESILLIDEVEGFLRDRRAARHGWEVTEVNEMLTRMESFPGIFIASTNLPDDLDQAALRRFDLKVKFDYLLPRQSRALLERYCESLHLDAPDNALTARISRLNNVTPGDFAVVERRNRFVPLCSAEAMVNALEQECSLKEGATHPIGFY